MKSALQVIIAEVLYIQNLLYLKCLEQAKELYNFPIILNVHRIWKVFNLMGKLN